MNYSGGWFTAERRGPEGAAEWITSISSARVPAPPLIVWSGSVLHSLIEEALLLLAAVIYLA